MCSSSRSCSKRRGTVTILRANHQGTLFGTRRRFWSRKPSRRLLKRLLFQVMPPKWLRELKLEEEELNWDFRLGFLKNTT